MERGGDEDGGVADAGVGVAGEEAAAIRKARRGHRQRHDFRARAVLEAQVTDALPVLSERAAVGFLDPDEGLAVDEAAEADFSESS